MAIHLSLSGTTLVVQLTGLDRLLAFTSRLTFDVTDVRGVGVTQRRLIPATGFRLPGTSVPGLLRAGTFGTRPNRDFWLVRKAESVLVIELQPGQPFRRLILEMPDPQSEATRLRPTLGAYTFDQ
jgi:hypothetical protein